MLPIRIELPEHFLDEEERDGYTVSTEMKKVWAVELDLLNEFQKVCEKYNLRYYASGGTLLGAVRHKGFIPWDDDIDVNMFREDYDKLVSVGQQAFAPPYCFQTTNVARHFFRGHAQLRNSLTTGILKSELGKGYNYNQGIFIDIFVMDGIPENKQAASLLYKRLNFYRRLLGNEVSLTHESIKGRALHGVLALLKRMGLDPQKIFEHFDNIARRASGKPARYTYPIEFISPPLCMFELADFGTPVELPFEFMSVKAPQNAEHILETQYGDWRTPVREPTYHGGVIFDPERPYTEYLNNGNLTDECGADAGEEVCS